MDENILGKVKFEDDKLRICRDNFLQFLKIHGQGISIKLFVYEF